MSFFKKITKPFSYEFKEETVTLDKIVIEFVMVNGTKFCLTIDPVATDDEEYAGGIYYGSFMEATYYDPCMYKVIKTDDGTVIIFSHVVSYKIIKRKPVTLTRKVIK